MDNDLDGYREAGLIELFDAHIVISKKKAPDLGWQEDDSFTGRSWSIPGDHLSEILDRLDIPHDKKKLQVEEPTVLYERRAFNDYFSNVMEKFVKVEGPSFIHIRMVCDGGMGDMYTLNVTYSGRYSIWWINE